MGMADFFRKMYEGYFAPIPDMEAYLRRIGLEGKQLPLTREGLDTFQFAQLCNVPFENLDLFDYELPVDFKIPELFDKIITRRRGGYCFELNAIYMALLEAAGFEVYPVGVRILMGGGDGFIPAIAHRASIAVIGGKRYFTDVGFGMTNAPGISICIDDYGEQDIQGDLYTVEDRPYNNKMIIRRTKEGPFNLFMFVPDPFNILDFITYNKTMSATGFRDKRMVNLRRPGGSISVDGDIFRITQNGERTEKTLESSDEAKNVLTEEFNMILTEPLGDTAARTAPSF